MTNYYWLLLPSGAFGLLALAMALLWRKEAHERASAEYQYGVYLMERDEARLALDRCERDKVLFGETIVTLNEDNLALKAQHADLLDALKDAQAEIKALNMQTIEVPQVAPVPARPKRPAKKAASE